MRPRARASAQLEDGTGALPRAAGSPHRVAFAGSRASLVLPTTLAHACPRLPTLSHAFPQLPYAVKTLLVVLVSASWGLLVEFFNWHVFLRLATFLNSWEGHRTVGDFEAHLVRKLFAFLFVDGFLWYFLLAFLHIPFGDRLRALFGMRDDTFQQVGGWRR